MLTTQPATPFRSWLSIYGGAGLTLLVVLYFLPGLFGHDPWRGDDIRHVAIVHGMLQGDSWLFPHLAGNPVTTYSPLYYWISAILAWASAGLVATHDVARFTTAMFTALAILWTARAAGRLSGKATRTPAALLTLGTLGLVVHAHEAQPFAAVMAMQALCLAGLTRVPQKPVKGSLQAAAGLAGAFLAGGPGGLLLTLPLLVIVGATSHDFRTPRISGALMLSLAVSLALCAIWPWLLGQQAPELFEAWWHQAWWGFSHSHDAYQEIFELAGWVLWPLWPIALWAAWQQRKHWRELRVQLPLLALLLACLQLVAAGRFSPPTLMPLVPPLALLAAAGVPTLRRGAANAFDWFALMCFGVFAVLVWLAWSAQVYAWPPGLARSLMRVAPDFALQPDWAQIVPGILICAVWLGLVGYLPRSLNRGPANWAIGLTMLWALSVTLLQPWFDHERNYRPLSESLARALQGEQVDCIAALNLSANHDAAFDYFSGIRTLPADDNATDCRYLLVRETREPAELTPLAPWQPIWEDRHAGGKRLEIFRLYRRD